MKPRDYQVEDLKSTLDALEEVQRVIGRAATGLGKAVLIGLIIKEWLKRHGRVIVWVDNKKLVRQLAATIKWVTGISPGIEMADERAIHENGYCAADRIVVACIQSMYAGGEGRERMLNFPKQDFTLGVVDECETSIAPTYRKVIDYFLENPEFKLFGCSATTYRTDGQAMANLYERVAFDRDIKWGISNGWLVPAKQAFVYVSADFSTLKVSPREDGEPDYSDEQVEALVNNEKNNLELAHGITKVANENNVKAGIVVGQTVAHAKAITDYLNGITPGCARCIWGELSEEDRNDIYADFEAGKFRFLVSVDLLIKGFDAPYVNGVFVCRKTKSKRLYTQIMGRGIRVLSGVVDGIEDANARIAAIANSDKPFAVIANMVSIDEEVRDPTYVDILGEKDEVQEILNRAKDLMKADEKLDAEKALEQAKLEVEDEQELERLAAEAESLKLEEEDEQAFLRRRVSVQAHVEVDYHEGIAPVQSAITGAEYISPAQLSMLRKFKVSEQEIAKMSPEAANKLGRTLIMRSKKGLCTWGQAKLLQRHGFTKEQLRTMSRQQAKEHIDRVMSK